MAPFSSFANHPKSLFCEPIYCDNNTYARICCWYQSFTKSCMDHNFYVHLIWNYHYDHGGTWGFTAGKSVDDDILLQLQIQLHKSTQVLFCLLQYKEIFPMNSWLIKVVNSCYSDGYNALKSILFKTHPAFYDQLSTFITSYPKQCNILLF